MTSGFVWIDGITVMFRQDVIKCIRHVLLVFEYQAFEYDKV